VPDWYILFVRSKSEEKIARSLAEKIDTTKATPFIPTTAKPHSQKRESLDADGKKQKRLWGKDKKQCFPGYVFISSQVNAVEFAQEIAPLVKRTDGVYRFLNYGDNKQDIVVKDNEKSLLERLMDKHYFIDSSKGFKEGNKVKVTEGPLVGMEGKIKKVNANKRTALVEFEFMGEVREFTVMLEVVKKEDADGGDFDEIR